MALRFIATSEGLGSTSWGPEASVVANTNILNYFLSVVWTIQTTFSCGLTVSAPHAGRQDRRPAVCVPLGWAGLLLACSWP